MRKKRVCCFCEKWESGGIESFLNNVLLRLDLNLIEVDVVAACLSESVFTQDLQSRGIQFFQLSGSQRKLRENHRAFAKLLKKRAYDVVHVNAFQGLSLYYLHLAMEANVPIRIAHSHNTDLRKSLTKPLKLMLHKLAANRYGGAVTDLWACSKAAAEFLFSSADLKRREYHFIPNGIEIERFRFNPEIRRRIRTELGLEDAFVIGNVGRLCYQKNQDFLLDVFAQVLWVKPESRLLLVGEGDQAKALQEKAERLGITQAVLFYGVSSHVEQLLWAMDIFVFPSRFEGLGIVAIEAQASGLRTLCSEHLPQEVFASKVAMQVPLNQEVWAHKILEETSFDRQEICSLMQDSEFDICKVAKKIQCDYCCPERKKQ